jgi:hypothetical protein
MDHPGITKQALSSGREDGREEGRAARQTHALLLVLVLESRGLDIGADARPLRPNTTRPASTPGRVAP